MTVIHTTRRYASMPALCLIAALGLAGCGDDEADAVDDAPVLTNDTGAATAETGKAIEKMVEKVEAEPVANAPESKAPEAPTPAKEEPVTVASSETTVAVSTAAQPEPQSVSQPAPEPKPEPAPEPEPKAEPAPAPKPKAKPKPKPLSGPHAATVAFFRAIMNGDVNAAASLVEGTEAQREAVRALARFQKAGNGFRRKFVTAYGAEAWAQFNDPRYAPEKPTSARPPFNASIPLFDQRDLEQMKLYQPRESGDEALYPSEQGDMRLVRADGKWRLDASTVLPTGSDNPEPARQMMSQQAAQIERFTGAIGRDGISADDLDVELGRAIIEARFNMEIPEPHRFDVASLPKAATTQ